MPEDTGKAYEGWSNYATWCVNMHIMQDEPNHHTSRILTRIASRAANREGRGRKGAITILADEIEQQITGSNPLAEESGLYADLLDAAIRSVDWREIATSWLEDVEFPGEEEEEGEE